MLQLSTIFGSLDVNDLFKIRGKTYVKTYPRKSEKGVLNAYEIKTARFASFPETQQVVIVRQEK